MAPAEKFNLVKCRFASARTEAEYRAYAFLHNISNNRIGIVFGVTLFALYIVLDFINLENPVRAAAIRTVAVAISLGVFLSLTSGWAARRHEALTAFIVGVLGVSMNVIIALEPTLDNSYYVGLIQAGVILSFLLRVNFTASIVTLATMLIGFAIAVSGKVDVQEAMLQCIVLVTMFATCGFGIYLVERYRRNDFLKSRLIAQQNEALNQMLADVRQDNERKIAAMNLLVHFVRTPLHQIVGFTDLVSNAIEDSPDGRLPPNCVEGVQFMKSASRELSQNVARVLAYYQLDELSRRPAADAVDVAEIARDYADGAPEGVRIRVAPGTAAATTRAGALKAALKALIEHYATAGASRVDIEHARDGDLVRLRILDDGPPMTASQFDELARPLNKLASYLTSNGSSMSMALRTIARAAEICGGELSHHARPDGNEFILSLRDYPAAKMTAPAAA